VLIAFPDWIKYDEMVGLLSGKVRSFDENRRHLAIPPYKTTKIKKDNSFILKEAVLPV